jgi:hypothetical protein
VLRQGELIHQPNRLAVRFPIVQRVPDDLPPRRREWLREVLIDGQNRWRMVRIGLAEEAGSSAALAEVDLSGCPHGLLESLFAAGLGALRWVVGWLVEAADFLVDGSVACRALEVCQVRA